MKTHVLMSLLDNLHAKVLVENFQINTRTLGSCSALLYTSHRMINTSGLNVPIMFSFHLCTSDWGHLTLSCT